MIYQGFFTETVHETHQDSFITNEPLSLYKWTTNDSDGLHSLPSDCSDHRPPPMPTPDQLLSPLKYQAFAESATYGANAMGIGSRPRWCRGVVVWGWGGLTRTDRVSLGRRVSVGERSWCTWEADDNFLPFFFPFQIPINFLSFFEYGWVGLSWVWVYLTHIWPNPF